MNKITYSIPALMVLGLVTFAPSAQALSNYLESETNVTVQSPVNDDDMVYVGPGGDTPVSNPSLTASVTRGAAPLAVSFTGTRLAADGTYIIDFGDGSNSGPLKTSNRCVQMTYPASPNCIGVGASHTYTVQGTYTATLQSYAACMWNDPRCEIDVQALGSVTIVVGENSSNGRIDNDGSAGNDENVIITQVGVKTDGSVNASGENTGFFNWVAGWNVWNVFGNGDDNDCGENGKLCPNQIGDGNNGNDGNINGGGNDVNNDNLNNGKDCNNDGVINAGECATNGNDGNTGNGGNANINGNVNGTVNVENRGFFGNIFWNFLNLF